MFCFDRSSTTSMELLVRNRLTSTDRCKVFGSRSVDNQRSLAQQKSENCQCQMSLFGMASSVRVAVAKEQQTNKNVLFSHTEISHQHFHPHLFLQVISFDIVLIHRDAEGPAHVKLSHMLSTLSPPVLQYSSPWQGAESHQRPSLHLHFHIRPTTGPKQTNKGLSCLEEPRMLFQSSMEIFQPLNANTLLRKCFHTPFAWWHAKLPKSPYPSADNPLLSDLTHHCHQKAYSHASSYPTVRSISTSNRLPFRGFTPSICKQ